MNDFAISGLLIGQHHTNCSSQGEAGCPIGSKH